MDPLGPESNNYVLAETMETEDGRSTMGGQINGGLFPPNPERPAQTPLIVIGVEDIRAAVAGVEGAGGKVYGEPDLIPNVGSGSSVDPIPEVRFRPFFASHCDFPAG